MKKRLRCYRKGVFIVVYRKTNQGVSFLLLKRKLHWKGWEFPKGGIEKNETTIQAVKRELKEESGLKPIKLKAYKITGSYLYDKKTCQDRKPYCGQSYKLYLVEVNSDSAKIKLDKKEHSAFKWVSFEKANKLLTWPNQKRALKIINEC
ncbi:MAG: NUDIX domain-containing protein [Candidatus Pacearchaeota archaeon]|jgi:8-oxo-dGTP pyrophosphatase MutT (NUDIX family)